MKQNFNQKKKLIWIKRLHWKILLHITRFSIKIWKHKINTSMKIIVCDALLYCCLRFYIQFTFILICSIFYNEFNALSCNNKNVSLKMNVILLNSLKFLYTTHSHIKLTTRSLSITILLTSQTLICSSKENYKRSNK